MKHTMIDLETMGLAPNGAIVAIGAVRFDPLADDVPAASADHFYTAVQLESSVAAGLVIYPSTVMWWLDRSQEARDALTGGVDLRVALKRLNEWFEPNSPGVWSHGKEFDLTILDTAFALVGLRPKWSYRDKRDTRTLFAVAGVEYKGVEHHALKDAVAQARAVQKAYRWLSPVGIVS